MAKISRICPHCYEQTGDTYEFDRAPPVGITCEDCGSRLQPRPPVENDGPEGWLYDRADRVDGYDRDDLGLSPDF